MKCIQLGLVRVCCPVPVELPDPDRSVEQSGAYPDRRSQCPHFCKRLEHQGYVQTDVGCSYFNHFQSDPQLHVTPISYTNMLISIFLWWRPLFIIDLFFVLIYSQFMQIISYRLQISITLLNLVFICKKYI